MHKSVKAIIMLIERNNLVNHKEIFLKNKNIIERGWHIKDEKGDISESNANV
jgi:hypothetical protein